MKKKAKIWIIVAASLILAGCILFAGVLAANDWDIMKLNTVKYADNTYEIHEDFNSISVDTDTADVLFARSPDGTCRVDCHEEENAQHSVTVKNGELIITQADNRSADYYISLNFDTAQITVYLPQEKYETLEPKISSGSTDTSDTADIHYTTD